MLLAHDVKRPLHQECATTDRACTRSNCLYRSKVLPKLAEGNVLASMDAGAYSSSYAMNFAFPRPLWQWIMRKWKCYATEKAITT